MYYITCVLLLVVAVSFSSSETYGGKPVVDVEDFPDYIWVCYAPTNFNPNIGDYPDESEIIADLEVLNDYIFTGIATYGSEYTLGDIPRLADEVGGFDVFIMGIFYFNEETLWEEEIPNALAAAEYVDAYCIGNEGLSERYTIEQLEYVMDYVATQTGLPVTTAEQIEDYLAGDETADWLLSHGDWLFPIIHPVNNGIYDPAAGVAWTEDRYNQILALADGKLVFVRETGWPTDGADWATEENQMDYFVLLAETDVFFSYFEAFDQPWKTWQPWEPYWGLFDRYRNPKLFLSEVGVYLTSFRTETAGGAVVVTWETAEETGLVGFNLYRRSLVTEGDSAFGGVILTKSKDQPWTQINPSLITGENPYEYTDEDVDGGITYEYCLEAVLEEGAETLGTTQVTTGKPSTFAILSLYPNPASETVTCLLSIPEGGIVELSLYDLSGRMVIEESYELSEPTELSAQLDVSSLASGVYTLQATCGDIQVSKRAVVVQW